jgi:hypothetical protein
VSRELKIVGKKKNVQNLFRKKLTQDQQLVAMLQLWRSVLTLCVSSLLESPLRAQLKAPDDIRSATLPHLSSLLDVELTSSTMEPTPLNRCEEVIAITSTEDSSVNAELLLGVTIHAAELPVLG